MANPAPAPPVMWQNEYILCPPDGPPVPWDDRPRDGAYPYLAFDYLDGAFRKLDAAIGAQGLTIFMTRDVNELPRYGDDVVAVVIGDEWSRLPRYAGQIRATFKEYGEKPQRLARLDARRPLYSAVAMVQYARNVVSRAPLVLGRLPGGSAKRQPLIATIPLGYYNQLDLPIRPFDERDVDVSFAGSVAHQQKGPFSPQRLIGTAKSHSRQTMLQSLERYRASRPQYRYDVGLTPSFDATVSTDAERYSERLMRARICLCPRGMSLETYRYFEAMRYGCILIVEELPGHWFYRGSPAIDVQGWEHLGDVLDTLLSDPKRLQALHAVTLQWWRDVCSEAALGRYMAEILAPTLR